MKGSQNMDQRINCLIPFLLHFILGIYYLINNSKITCSYSEKMEDQESQFQVTESVKK